MKRKILNIMSVMFMLIVISSCSHKTSPPLVGSDRDSHGCIASAGYIWSEARKDCIRVWEEGEALEKGEDRVFVVFSNDSTIAEVYLEKGKCISLKKIKDKAVWKSKKSGESISVSEKSVVFTSEKGVYRKIKSK